jgi:hypothetical protein
LRARVILFVCSAATTEYLSGGHHGADTRAAGEGHGGVDRKSRKTGEHAARGRNRCYKGLMTNTARVVTATAAMAAALGFAGLGTATVAQAQPLRPFPEYHWCPGEPWNDAWGNNFSVDGCHDDHYFDGQPRDEAHWHGYTPFDPNWQADGGGHRPRAGATVTPVGDSRRTT